MAIVKEIQINLTDDDAKKGLNDINKLFKEVSKSEEQAVQSTKSLRTQLRELQQQLASGQLKGEEFRQASIRAGELRDAIGDANQRINALASDTGRLDGLIEAGAGIAGAFSVAQGAMAVFGEENEEVQQAILKVQGSLAILNGVQAVANTLNKDSALMVQLQTRGLAGLVGVQGLYSTVVGASTGALKAFRIALATTGIGAIVVGVGLLVANFEKVSKWVTDLIDKFGGWRKMLMTFLPVIGLVVKGLEAIGVIDDEATAKAKANAEKRIEAGRKQSKELDKQKAKLENYYDFELAKQKASGKSTEELEQTKRNAILKTLYAQNEAERALINSNKRTNEDIKRWNERQSEITKLIQAIQVAEIEGQTKANEARKKANEEAVKNNKDRLEKQQAEEKKSLDEKLKLIKDDFDQQRKIVNENTKISAKDRAELLKQINQAESEAVANHKKALQDLENKYIVDIENLNAKTDQQKLDLQRSRELKELEQLAKTEEEKQRLLIQFNEKFRILQAELDAKTEAEKNAREEQKLLNEANNPLLNIESRLEAVRLREELENSIIFASEDERTAYQKANADARIEIAKAEMNAKIQMAEQVSKTLSDISNVLGKETAAGKAFAVASATIETFLAAQRAYSATVGIPVIGPALAKVNYALALVSGFKNIRQILSVKTPGGGGGGGGVPSAGGITSGASATPTAAPQFSTIGNNPVSQIAEAVGNQPPVQAFVVGSQVTSQQALDRNIITNASLG
jgi:hypothetical protein